MRETDATTLVERVQGRLGELALRAAGGHCEIIANGVFLMDTRNGASERLIVRLALGDRPGPMSLLIGGLGVGFSLAEALACERVARATVVEIEPKIIEWGRSLLAPFSGNALADPRAEIVNADFLTWLERTEETFDAIALDIDNGPAWTVAETNAWLYADEGLALLCQRLKPGGALTVWSAAEAPGFAEALQGVFDRVETVRVPVPKGEPDVVYVARRA